MESSLCPSETKFLVPATRSKAGTSQPLGLGYRVESERVCSRLRQPTKSDPGRAAESKRLRVLISMSLFRLGRILWVRVSVSRRRRVIEEVSAEFEIDLFEDWEFW